MPEYFYHLHEGSEILTDPEGVLLANVQAARAVARRHIRDLVAGDVRTQGVVDLDRTLQVCQPTDADVFLVTFEEDIVVRSRR